MSFCLSWSRLQCSSLVYPSTVATSDGTRYHEVHHSEASIAAHEQGECVSGGPGSQTIAGHSTVHSGLLSLRMEFGILKKNLTIQDKTLLS